MRFKRLKLAIGISLLVFVFIVANVILIGSIQGKISQNNGGVNLAAPIYTNRNPSVQAQPQQQVQQQAPVYHPSLFARAS